MGSVLTTRDYLGIYYWNTISSLAHSMVFMLAQGREFIWLGYWMDDSELGCIYMYLSGLHFIHVSYGIITLGASSNPIHSLEVLPIYTVPMDMYYIMDYYYWHIVEIVYIYIYITLYYYYDIL